jgi:hypothetical protein
MQVKEKEINERPGLMFSMIANYFCEIIVKVRVLEVNRVFWRNMPDSFHLDDFFYYIAVKDIVVKM